MLASEFCNAVWIKKTSMMFPAGGELVWHTTRVWQTDRDREITYWYKTIIKIRTWPIPKRYFTTWFEDFCLYAHDFRPWIIPSHLVRRKYTTNITIYHVLDRLSISMTHKLGLFAKNAMACLSHLGRHIEESYVASFLTRLIGSLWQNFKVFGWATKAIFLRTQEKQIKTAVNGLFLWDRALIIINIPPLLFFFFFYSVLRWSVAVSTMRRQSSRQMQGQCSVGQGLPQLHKARYGWVFLAVASNLEATPGSPQRQHGGGPLVVSCGQYVQRAANVCQWPGGREDGMLINGHQ